MLLERRWFSNAEIIEALIANIAPEFLARQHLVHANQQKVRPRDKRIECSIEDRLRFGASLMLAGFMTSWEQSGYVERVFDEPRRLHRTWRVRATDAGIAKWESIEWMKYQQSEISDQMSSL